MKKITIYTTNYCGFCAQAKTLLDSRSLSYHEIDVTHNTTLRQEMEQRSGRRTVPQIFFDEQAIGGCSDLQAITAANQLDEMLGN